MALTSESSVGWVPAKDLSEFSFEKPGFGEVPFVREALAHYARTRGFENWPQMQLLGAGRDYRTRK